MRIFFWTVVLLHCSALGVHAQSSAPDSAHIYTFRNEGAPVLAEYALLLYTHPVRLRVHDRFYESHLQAGLDEICRLKDSIGKDELQVYGKAGVPYATLRLVYERLKECGIRNFVFLNADSVLRPMDMSSQRKPDAISTKPVFRVDVTSKNYIISWGGRKTTVANIAGVEAFVKKNLGMLTGVHVTLGGASDVPFRRVSPLLDLFDKFGFTDLEVEMD